MGYIDWVADTRMRLGHRDRRLGTQTDIAKVSIRDYSVTLLKSNQEVAQTFEVGLLAFIYELGGEWRSGEACWWAVVFDCPRRVCGLVSTSS